MWPLGILFLFATAAPQKNPVTFVHDPNQAQSSAAYLNAPADQQQDLQNTCYTIRSYFFEKLDGQAPVPKGMTTCTPANISQQRRILRTPDMLLMPLALRDGQQSEAPK